MQPLVCAHVRAKCAPPGAWTSARPRPATPPAPTRPRTPPPSLAPPPRAPNSTTATASSATSGLPGSFSSSCWAATPPFTTSPSPACLTRSGERGAPGSSVGGARLLSLPPPPTLPTHHHLIHHHTRAAHAGRAQRTGTTRCGATSGQKGAEAGGLWRGARWAPRERASRAPQCARAQRLALMERTLSNARVLPPLAPPVRSPEAIDLIKNLLVPDPSERLTVAQVGAGGVGGWWRGVVRGRMSSRLARPIPLPLPLLNTHSHAHTALGKPTYSPPLHPPTHLARPWRTSGSSSKPAPRHLRRRSPACRPAAASSPRATWAAAATRPRRPRRCCQVR